MCIYSLYVHKDQTTTAKVGKTLTLRSLNGHAVFKDDNDKVVCIKHNTSITIDALCFATGIAGCKTISQPDGSNVMVALLENKYERKKVVATMVKWHNRQRPNSADALQLPCGTMCHLAWFKFGMTASVPRKVRKDKGVRKLRNLDKALELDQIKADVPLDRKVDA